MLLGPPLAGIAWDLLDAVGSESLAGVDLVRKASGESKLRNASPANFAGARCLRHERQKSEPPFSRRDKQYDFSEAALAAAAGSFPVACVICFSGFVQSTRPDPVRRFWHQSQP